MKAYRPSAVHVPELNGLRVLLVFIVSWYHIWQQSWWTPYVGSYSLDWLVRSGYTPVDGTILLSGFLLFLPHARAMLLGEKVPSTRLFYQRRVMRIVPSYFFVTLLMLFAVAIPYGLYWREQDMWRDVLMHLTFTQTFNYATYIATPIGVASWTIAIEMQAYLIFPLLAKGARKNAWGMLATMAAVALGFRGWCLFAMADYNMVVNQLVNFLDVYAIGMAAALCYVKLTMLYPAEDAPPAEPAGETPRRRFNPGARLRLMWQCAATLVVVTSVWALVQLLQAQAGSNGQTAIQAGQMLRRPLFALLLAAVTVALPFTVRPLRFLMGNRLMGLLAMVSMNYYLMHQNIAVHLRRVGFPPSVSETPNMARETPWMYQYTFLCFGLSLVTAVAITLLVEKPGAWLLKKLFAAVDERVAHFRAVRAPQEIVPCNEPAEAPVSPENDDEKMEE